MMNELQLQEFTPSSTDIVAGSFVGTAWCEFLKVEFCLFNQCVGEEENN